MSSFSVQMRKLAAGTLCRRAPQQQRRRQRRRSPSAQRQHRAAATHLRVQLLIRQMRWSCQPLVQLLRAVQQRQVGSQAIGLWQSVQLRLARQLPSQKRALRLQCQPMHMCPHTLSPMLRRMTMMLNDGRS